MGEMIKTPYVMTLQAQTANKELWRLIERHQNLIEALQAPHVQAAGKFAAVFRLGHGLKLQVAPRPGTANVLIRPCYAEPRPESQIVYGLCTAERPFLADSLRLGIAQKTLGMTALTKELGGGYREEVDIDLAHMDMRVVPDENAAINQRPPHA